MAVLHVLLACFIGLHRVAAEFARTGCSDGFISHDQHCYKILSGANVTSWMAAQTACEELKGILAEPVDKGTTDFLLQLALFEHELTGDNEWYLGLTDLFSEGRWYCPTSRVEPNSTLWQEGSPSEDSLNILDCASMKIEDGEIHWKDIECYGQDSGSILPLCQKISCPEGMTEFENSCYAFENRTAMRWDYAEDNCEKKGGHLASVHSDEEQNFISSLIQGTNATNVWLGGIVTGSTPTSFRWSDGSPVDYTHWDANRPAGYDRTTIRTSDMDWFDLGYTNSFYYVCKVNVMY